MSARIREYTFQGEPGTEAEDFLRKEHHLGPRQSLKDAFLSGRVHIGDRVAKRQSPLHPGDRVRVEMTGLYTPSDLVIHPADVAGVSLLQEGADFVALSKPSGVHAHPHHPDERDTAVNWLAKRFPECASPMNPERPLEGGLVHRLDQGTSGILLAAKSLESLHRLRAAWRDPAMEKIYVARLAGEFQFTGRIFTILSHDPKNAARMIASPLRPRSGSCWESHTTIQSRPTPHGYSLALVRIHTGVMHQIRAVCAALGHPLVGDPIYKAATKSDLVRHESADSATLSRFSKLQTHAAGIFSDAPREFWLHALWLKLPGIAGLDQGLTAL